MGSPEDYCRCWAATRRRVACYQATFAADPWGIVFQFYAALQLLEGYFRTKPARFHTSINHRDRDKALRESPELRAARAPYKGLKGMSESVRYDPTFEAQDVDLKQASKHLQMIESILFGKLKKNSGIDCSKLL